MPFVYLDFKRNSCWSLLAILVYIFREQGTDKRLVGGLHQLNYILEERILVCFSESIAIIRDTTSIMMNDEMVLMAFIMLVTRYCAFKFLRYEEECYLPVQTLSQRHQFEHAW
jgi:hypothetical protein